MCVNMPNFIKIGQTVGEIWRFNGFQNGGRLTTDLIVQQRKLQSARN